MSDLPMGRYCMPRCVGSRQGVSVSGLHVLGKDKRKIEATLTAEFNFPRSTWWDGCEPEVQSPTK